VGAICNNVGLESASGKQRVIGKSNRYQRIGLFLLSLLGAILLLLPPSSRAQQTDLSQQMQLFNNLPQDQQQSLLQRLGSGGGTGLGSLGTGGTGSMLGGLGGYGGYNSSQAALLQQQMLQQQRRGQEEQENNPLLPPVFKSGDTVLVNVSFPGELPPGVYFPYGTTQGLGQQVGQLPNQQQALPFIPGVGSGAGAGQSAAAQLLIQQQLQQQLAQQQLAQQQLGGSSLRPQEQPLKPAEELAADEKQRLSDLIDLIRAHNPYDLDSAGELLLPGIPPMALAGLTEDLASRRVAAEPAFAKLQISVTRLPLKKAGQEALKPFGYDLFDNSMLGYQPMLNLPVPAEYVIGPGDELQVQLFGSQNQNLQLLVERDGHISFPQLGPIEVGGQRYIDAKNEIEQRVSRQMIGVHASVSMGELRAINVFVLGAAKYPGSYTVAGLGTITTALFAAGGVNRIGSLRNIQLKRQGQLVRTLDLYDLLMRGDSTNDVRLLPGDVVFIPSIGPTVSIDGEVERPAIYELKGSASVHDLVQMGGGLKPLADRANAALVRIDEQQRRVVLNVNPASAGATPTIHNGDALEILRLPPQLDSGVTVQGYVYRPKYFAWQEGLRLSRVIASVDELKPNADQNYLLIRRELPLTRRITVMSADLAAALRAPGSASDMVLMPRDTITVFDLETSRDQVIRSLLDELRVQSSLSQPVHIVHVDGRVKVPGDYPLESGMRISDLLRAGGNLDSAAYGVHAELSRYSVVDGEQRRTEVLPVDLAAIRAGDPQANLELQAFDRLSIKQISGWTDQDQVTLRGEVRFPGTYTIKQGETLRSVVERAGGLTAYAFPQGSLFTRTELKVREQEQLDRFAERMRTDIAEEALEAARGGSGGSSAALSIGQTLLDQLKSAKAVGRLVINLNAAIHARPGSSDDVILRNGDDLIVPKFRQEIMVIGEVEFATSHLYKRSMVRDDYIDQSGGPTRQADKKRIYVVRADGSVESGRRGWFTSSSSVEIRPGDSIVVPLDTEKLPPLILWQTVTSILYNIAIATAVAKTNF
jgi:protein involved in polysaccharide export with SLBB domain